jgi:hypothetical protein
VPGVVREYSQALAQMARGKMGSRKR